MELENSNERIFQKIDAPWGVYTREKYLCKKIGLKAFA